MKRAVQSGAEAGFLEGLAIERELQQLLFQSDDAKEGIAANLGNVNLNSRVSRPDRQVGRVRISKTIMQKQLFINNEWRAAASGKTMDVINPATEEVCASVASADRQDLDAAVDARSKGPQRTVGTDVGARARAAGAQAR